MRPKWACGVAILILIWAGPLSAGSVYFWTDENGVRHYSNTGVPSDVQEADVRPEEVAPEVSSSPPDADVDAEVEENLPGEQEGAPGEGAPEAAVGTGADDRLAAQTEKERQRLKAEIEKIEGLAIGTSFTPGMKAARIAPLKEQLALLNADPKRYFRMKRQGAFDNTGGSPSAPAGPLGGSLQPIQPSVATGSDSTGEALEPQEEANP